MRSLKRLEFDISYLALLTRERVKPLSRWEGPFSRRQVKALRRLGLKTDTVQRSLLNGGTTNELIFSTSSRYLDIYRKKYHHRPITKDRQTVTTEGFLFGYPGCCVENFARNGYTQNEFQGRGQEILFHWACPGCRATPELLPYYRKIHQQCQDACATHGPSPAQCLKRSLPAAALSVLFALLPATTAGAYDAHWLPLGENDPDGDYLTYAEEVLQGTGWAIPIGEDPFGPQEAIRYADIIKSLPGHPTGSACWADSTIAFGIEHCQVCDTTVNMGFLTIHNPLRGLSIEMPFMALHFMEHGSFSYNGDLHDGRVDLELLKKVLSPFDDDHHMLVTTGDSDQDGLRDEYEPPFSSLVGDPDSNSNGLDDGAEAAENLIVKFSRAPVIGPGEKIPRDMPYVQYQPVYGVETCDVCGMTINMGTVRVVNPSSRMEMTFPIIGLHYLAHGRFAYRAGSITGEVDARRLNALFRDLHLRHREEPVSDEVVTALVNHPNPFNESTEIRLTIGRTGPVSVKIYNINGQLVRNLLDDHLDAGDHRLHWNGQDEHERRVASGIYFCRLEYGGSVKATKMLLVK